MWVVCAEMMVYVSVPGECVGGWVSKRCMRACVWDPKAPPPNSQPVGGPASLLLRLPSLKHPAH